MRRAALALAIALAACTISVALHDSPGACVACRVAAPGAPASAASGVLERWRHRLAPAPETPER